MLSGSPRLIVEEVLAVKIEREPAAQSVCEISAEACDSIVLSPVSA